MGFLEGLTWINCLKSEPSAHVLENNFYYFDCILISDVYYFPLCIETVQK